MDEKLNLSERKRVKITERCSVSEISKNWAGHPLESFETLLNFVRNTKTENGLRIEAYFDEREYEKGITIKDKEFKKLNMTRNDELGTWNYTIKHTQILKEEALYPLEKVQQEPLATIVEGGEPNWEYLANSESTASFLQGVA